jgi:hypothetical protein
MVSKFTKLLKELRALSHEERMERAKALAKAWAEYEKRRQD